MEEFSSFLKAIQDILDSDDIHDQLGCGNRNRTANMTNKIMNVHKVRKWESG